MEGQIIRPTKEEIQTFGKMFYDNSMRAWNTFRLKNDMLKEFKALKEKQSKFSYKLVFYQEYGQLEKAFRKLKRNKEPLPVLMWFVKEKN